MFFRAEGLTKKLQTQIYFLSNKIEPPKNSDHYFREVPIDFSTYIFYKRTCIFIDNTLHLEIVLAQALFHPLAFVFCFQKSHRFL